MDTVDSDKDAGAIARTFHAAGHHCIRANYWASDYLPKNAFLSSDMPMITLVDGGLQNAPRLTEEDYRKAGGGVTDFADLALHDHGVHGWPLSEHRLSLESIYYQRLRGAAVKARALLRSIDPDLIVVQQGAEPVSRAIAIEAGSMNIPTLISESSFFPGYINLDVGAQHFFRGLSRIDRELPRRMENPLTPAEADQVSAFIDDWTRGHVSKYEQQSAPAELEKVRAFTASAAGRVVFLAGQMPCDANVLPGLRRYAMLHDLYAAAIGALGNDWRVIVKAHPKDESGSMNALGSLPNVLIVEEVSIHDAIPLSDVVLVHSSNVGLEALMLGKPVVVLGNPLYSGLGLTTDVENVIDLGERMCSAVAMPPDKEKVHRLLHFLLMDHLIPAADSRRVESRIAEAIAAGPAVRDSLRILAPAYSECARDYLGKIRDYNALARQNYFDAEIHQRLRTAAHQPETNPRRSLNSGERQVPHDYADVELDHLTRYCLADAMLRPNLTILDIACGTGYGTHLMAEKAFSVIGVDASDEAIDFAKSFWPHEKAAFHRASAGEWFAQDHAKYDAIVTYQTVEHMYDAQLFLRAIWSRLCAGGVLFLSSPNAAFYPLTDNAFHVRHFDAEELERLLRTLPDVADFRIWSQCSGVIGPKVRSGRFLVSAIAKAGDTSALHRSLDELMPFRITELPIRRSFRIGAESFSTNIATKGPKEITTAFAPSDGCIVFGPYYKLSAGRYSVLFDLSFSGQDKPGTGELMLEVTNTQDELMARRRLSPAQLVDPDKDLYSLQFHNEKLHLPIEFRVHARGKPISGTLHFRGVHIQRLD